jgi:hypothetical protein
MHRLLHALPKAPSKSAAVQVLLDGMGHSVLLSSSGIENGNVLDVKNMARRKGRGGGHTTITNVAVR